MYIFIAIIAYLFLAVVGILDKFIVDKTIKHPVVVVFYSTIFLLPLFLLYFFGAHPPVGWFDWGAAIVSGFLFSLAIWASYIGLQGAVVSRMGPLIGAATPFFVFWLSGFLLHEQFTTRQILAMALLIVGSLIIAFEIKGKQKGFHRGMLWGVLAGLLFAISHVASKYLYTTYGFYSALVWSRGFMGVFGVLLLAHPAVRAIFIRRKRGGNKLLAHQIMVVGVDKIIATVAVLLEQYAIAIGSVTIVNALIGIQYVGLIFLVMILSRYWPRVFKENFSRAEIWQEFLAVAVIGAGLVLLI